MSNVEQYSAHNWTARLRRRIARTVPPGQWLPDRQPAYVRSWIYVFGVLTLAALVVVIGSGIVLTLGGVSWWHTSSVGHFVNSAHLWSVELFFAFMVIHLWGKFFMAAWRGKRALTWITGVVSFVASIGTAFTGYLSQSNFDSQWISTQAKDGLNAVGIGAYFNVLNPGQMLLWHVALLPLVIGVLVVAHVILVRRHGVVPPFDAVPPSNKPAADQPDQPDVPVVETHQAGASR
ncbi:MAG: cytochrome b N-terminal domain-containing protein [Antricoccus sp.]